MIPLLLLVLMLFLMIHLECLLRCKAFQTRKKTKAQIFTKPFNVLWLRFSVVQENSVSEVFIYMYTHTYIILCPALRA